MVLSDTECWWTKSPLLQSTFLLYLAFFVEIIGRWFNEMIYLRSCTSLCVLYVSLCKHIVWYVHHRLCFILGATYGLPIRSWIHKATHVAPESLTACCCWINRVYTHKQSVDLNMESERHFVDQPFPLNHGCPASEILHVFGNVD